MNKKFSSSQPLQIQLAVDGSEYAMAAVQMLSDLPLPPGSRITILSVLTAGSRTIQDVFATGKPGFFHLQ